MNYIATHSGSFHADDVFAASVLIAILRSAEPTRVPASLIRRTRDPEVIAQCTYAVDVGGEYVPARGRFDHHQKGFAERRPNSIPYAAAGLVWKHKGAEYVATRCADLSADALDQVVAIVDARLVQYLDAIDTGHMSPGVLPASLPLLISTLNPTWQELDGLSDTTVDHRYWLRFDTAMHLTTQLLQGLVQEVIAEVEAAGLVRSSEHLNDGQILVLDKAGLPWNGPVCLEMPKVLFVVYPASGGRQYQLRVALVNPDGYTARMNLPTAWAGLHDADLAAVTGVPDAVFCHNGLFIAGARSREGAIQLARLALASA